MKVIKHPYALSAAVGILPASASLQAHSTDDAPALADMLAEALNSRTAGAEAALYRDGAEFSEHNAPTPMGRGNIRSYWKAVPIRGNLPAVLKVTRTLDE